MTGPLHGARMNGGGGKAADARELRDLRRAVRELSLRLSKVERWMHWAAGGMAALTGTVVVNTIRSWTGG